MEDTGSVLLADDGGEGREQDTAELIHKVFRERRRGIQTDGRKLGGIAHQDHPATDPVPDIGDQVFQQVARSESGTGRTAVNPDKRHFIHDIERILRLVRRQRELAKSVTGDGLAPVDMLVDGIGRTARIRRQDLGCTAGGGQQHTGDLHLPHRGHDGRQRGGLARSRIAVRHQDIPVVLGQESGDISQEGILAGGGFVSEMGKERTVKEFPPVHGLALCAGENHAAGSQDRINLHAAQEHVQTINHLGHGRFRTIIAKGTDFAKGRSHIGQG